MDSKEYWNKRALEDSIRSITITERFIKSKLKKYYSDADDEIQEYIEQLYESFADKENITLAEAKRKIKNASFIGIDYKSFVEVATITQDKVLLSYINALSKKGQISRLELLHLEVQKTLANLFYKEQTNIFEHLLKQYEDSYFKGIYNFQTYMQAGFDFIRPDEKVLKKAVTQSWSKMNFSQRIWGHRLNLAEDLRSHINVGLIQGNSINKIAAKISKDINVSLNNAIRLVRTETNYIHNQATLDTYINYAGIEEYKYLATLDFRTSAICQELDGKIFKTEDAKVGTNYPPMHPNCRSTTIPYFADDTVGERIARASDGKTYYVPGDMTYKDWFNSLSEDEKGKMRLNLKKHQNRSQDIKQFENYKSVLGKDAPKTIEKFQNIKYDNKEEWNKLKLKYRNQVLTVNPKIQNGFKNYTNPKSIPNIYKDYVNSLSQKDKDLLQQYTGFTATNVNRALRKKLITDNIKSQINYLDKIVNNGVLPENVILKRGTIIQSFIGFENVKNINELDLSMLKNKIIKDNAFGSTSLIKAETLGRDVIMNIYAPKGFKGAVYLEPVAYDKYKSQYEVLLKRGCNYRILDAIIKENKLHLEVQLLDD